MSLRERLHAALHVLCGVIWNEWGKAVTGGNMEPLAARMDFEFDPLPEGFAARQVEQTGAIAPIAGPLFNEYLLAFEVTSVLLLAAVVGAVILGKQRGDEHAR